MGRRSTGSGVGGQGEIGVCEAACINREREREKERSPTIFGFAGAVVWLQQVTLHTAAGVRALTVGARLAASPVHVALIKIYRRTTILSFYRARF